MNAERKLKISLIKMEHFNYRLNIKYLLLAYYLRVYEIFEEFNYLQQNLENSSLSYIPNNKMFFVAKLFGFCCERLKNYRFLITVF